jgi:hypothetical protein
MKPCVVAKGMALLAKKTSGVLDVARSWVATLERQP